MSFKKDGETKVYVEKVVRSVKNASQKKVARYTIDDLVRDSEDTQETQLDEERKNVSD